MIRGTSHDQDARFKDKAHKMLLQSKWPDKYDIKIDLNKVQNLITLGGSLNNENMDIKKNNRIVGILR